MSDAVDQTGWSPNTTRDKQIKAIREKMIHLHGVGERLNYLEGLDPQAVAVAQEYIRLSRLADYRTESPDGKWRNWGSRSEVAYGTQMVDAILRDVFQGRKDHLREQMLDVAAKSCRKMAMQPWWESIMVEEIEHAVSVALRKKADA